jgi:hypothetical protein
MIKPGEIKQKANAVGVRDQQIEKDILLPENVSTGIVEKRLTLATRKNERNEKKIQFSIQSTGCD